MAVEFGRLLNSVEHAHVENVSIDVSTHVLVSRHLLVAMVRRSA
ncbi:hypothetical protein SAMN02799622_01294, partial [Methylobacterium sp. UNC378MF]